MKKILVTGGPVHAYLDPVKIVTNRFKGGMMRQVVDNLISTYKNDVEVTYLVPKIIDNKLDSLNLDHCKVVFHNGFDEYYEAVLGMAPQMDGVVLGAAVANLIPAEPYKTKFPSHNYKVGDLIPINFKIAPRVIDEVKRVAPNTHLFGFKLLSGYPLEELISAAYGVVLESKAVTVFANDAKDLLNKYAVTKERSVIKLTLDDLHRWIWDTINDVYYRTELVDNLPTPEDRVKLSTLIEQHKSMFKTVEDGYVFGTVAVRSSRGTGFTTTCRGKKELENVTKVTLVDHTTKTVFAGPHKATLNAPLLDRLFNYTDLYDSVDYIIHVHEQMPNLPTLPYAFPGTVKDTLRDIQNSFNVENHGCYMLFNKEGEIV